MHKRRIDLLLPVLLELNSQFYLQVCRQIQFEIGEIYSEMTDLKIAIADQEGIVNFLFESFPHASTSKSIFITLNCGKIIIMYIQTLSIDKQMNCICNAIHRSLSSGTSVD